jgi:hypothetical protein
MNIQHSHFTTLKTMSASSSLLDEVFELLTLATHLEEAKEHRVEAATKVCISETETKNY